MKLKEYIKKLQDLGAQYGENLEIIYASDDEGNVFRTLSYEPSACEFIEEDATIKSLEDHSKINAVCIN